MKKHFSSCLMLVGFFGAMMFVSKPMAAEFHVTNATEFQNALNTASNNGQDDTIHLAAGIYHGNFRYTPPNTEHKSLTIAGEPGTRTRDVVLNGQDNSIVLYLFDWSDGSLAEVVLRGITVENGNENDSLGGGGIHASLAAYNISIRNCIIKNNAATRNGGGIYMINQMSSEGTLTLEDSLILHNVVVEDPQGVSSGGGVSMFSYRGSYIIRNNVIAGNKAQGPTDPQGGGLKAGWRPDNLIHVIGNTVYGNDANKGGGIFFSNADTVNLYNNIVYGNTATQGEDICFESISNRIGHNNNYSNMYGAWTVSDNNMNTDPLFVSPKNNDYHLRPNSPMVNAGKSDVPSPPGLPVTDFEGDPRPYGEAPDMGADEYGGDKYYPEEGTLGTEIALLGSGFGSRKRKVLVGSSALKVLEWKGETIRCQLTRVLSPDTYNVTIRPGTKGSVPIVLPDAFAVKAPKIDSVSPTHGSAGEEIITTGSFFGTKKVRVTLGEKSCKIRSWTMDPIIGTSEIRLVVPRGLSLGTQELKVINKVGEDTEGFAVN